MIECPHCKHGMTESSRYCSQCGKLLKDEEKHDRMHPLKSRLPVLTPVIVLIVMGAALYFVYAHEQQVNREVIAMKKEAEEVALSGNYREAETLLANAVDHRPHIDALQEELLNIQTALTWNRKLDEVHTLLEEGSLSKASEQLNAIEKELQEKDSQLLLTLVPKMNEMDSLLTLKEVNQELSKVTDVEELAAKLNTLSQLNLEEASKVREKIHEKIVNQSTKKAEEVANEKRYTEAIAIVDQGLQYVSNDEKLIQLKERIQQEKQAFEQAEQQRMERAMQQAAEDELVNETEALKVLDIHITKDEFGDYIVSGKLESVATQIISTITVKYDILNADDKVVRSESAKVYPLYLNPGKKGSFEKVYYELEEGEYSVEMTEMEWLVE